MGRFILCSMELEGLSVLCVVNGVTVLATIDQGIEGFITAIVVMFGLKWLGKLC